jgi:hypothetical protein
MNDFVSAVKTHRRTMFNRPSIFAWMNLSLVGMVKVVFGSTWVCLTKLPSSASPRMVVRLKTQSAVGRGIMLNIRLVTTAAVEARWTAEIEDTEIGHGTAFLSRLVQTWACTGRILCAEFCFASVEAAEVMGGMGLKFIGVVKTATKRYPMAILSGRELSRRGERVSLSCDIN